MRACNRRILAPSDLFSHLPVCRKLTIDALEADNTQPVTDPPSGRLMQNILQSFGQFDNEQRAERSIRRMRRQAEAGRFLNPAHLGDRNNGKANRSMVFDEAAPSVRGMYKRIGDGHSQSDALKWQGRKYCDNDLRYPTHGRMMHVREYLPGQ